jgi:hypothetical protein
MGSAARSGTTVLQQRQRRLGTGTAGRGVSSVGFNSTNRVITDQTLTTSLHLVHRIRPMLYSYLELDNRLQHTRHLLSGPASSNRNLVPLDHIHRDSDLARAPQLHKLPVQYQRTVWRGVWIHQVPDLRVQRSRVPILLLKVQFLLGSKSRDGAEECLLRERELSAWFWSLR